MRNSRKNTFKAGVGSSVRGGHGLLSSQNIRSRNSKQRHFKSSSNSIHPAIIRGFCAFSVCIICSFFIYGTHEKVALAKSTKSQAEFIDPLSSLKLTKSIVKPTNSKPSNLSVSNVKTEPVKRDSVKIDIVKSGLSIKKMTNDKQVVRDKQVNKENLELARIPSQIPTKLKLKNKLTLVKGRVEKLASQDSQAKLPEAKFAKLMVKKTELQKTPEVVKALPIVKSQEILNPITQDLNGIPHFSQNIQKEIASSLSLQSTSHDQIELPGNLTGDLTLDSRLQKAAQKALSRNKVRWGAVAVIQPSTGKVLALASRKGDSSSEDTALRASFPSASIFKIVTAAAAIERSGLDENTVIPYRGGNYTLNKFNYKPSKKRDGNRMMLGEAFGKSCNPAFARVALKNLDSQVVSDYADSLHYNSEIPFDLPVATSLFEQPEGDYSLARTAAGFQNSYMSPLHAALIASSIANGGKSMRPYIVENLKSQDGSTLYSAEPKMLKKSLLPSTAHQLKKMMSYSTSMGTARKGLKNLKDSSGRSIKVIGKTGTLSGKSPKGRYTWFVGIAEKAMKGKDADIALATMVIDQGKSRTNGTGLAKSFLQEAYKKM